MDDMIKNKSMSETFLDINIQEVFAIKRRGNLIDLMPPFQGCCLFNFIVYNNVTPSGFGELHFHCCL